jgi:hypothetical protein
MATPPRKAPAAKKAGTRKIAAPAGVQIETLLNNASVKITRTTMQPGAEIAQQGRGSDYMIFAVTEYSVVRRFTRNAKVTREVAISGTPGKPYFARATKSGAEFSLVNVGRTTVVFDKIVLKRAKET